MVFNLNPNEASKRMSQFTEAVSNQMGILNTAMSKAINESETISEPVQLLEATRINVFTAATEVLKNGKKPKLSDIADQFTKPTCSALRVYFSEWKDENSFLLKEYSATELELLMQVEQLRQELKETQIAYSELDMAHQMLSHKLNNSDFPKLETEIAKLKEKNYQLDKENLRLTQENEHLESQLALIDTSEA